MVASSELITTVAQAVIGLSLKERSNHGGRMIITAVMMAVMATASLSFFFSLLARAWWQGTWLHWCGHGRDHTRGGQVESTKSITFYITGVIGVVSRMSSFYHGYDLLLGVHPPVDHRRNQCLAYMPEFPLLKIVTLYMPAPILVTLRLFLHCFIMFKHLFQSNTTLNQ